MDASPGPSELGALLAEARSARDGYDYERARELLGRAFALSHGELEAAQALLELLVDVLGLDDVPLALEPRLARGARRAPGVRARLGTAAARLGKTARALGHLEGLDDATARAHLLDR